MRAESYRLMIIMFVAYNGISIFAFVDTENYAYLYAAICANCLITFLSSRK